MDAPKYETALIVGAGEGLSASLARLFAREEINVALAARKIEKLGALCGETGAHVGHIEPGYFADLVILKSNPVGDIAHASDIDTVIKNGVAYPADSILR